MKFKLAMASLLSLAAAVLIPCQASDLQGLLKNAPQSSTVLVAADLGKIINLPAVKEMRKDDPKFDKEFQELELKLAAQGLTIDQFASGLLVFLQRKRRLQRPYHLNQARRRQAGGPPQRRNLRSPKLQLQRRDSFRTQSLHPQGREGSRPPRRSQRHPRARIEARRRKRENHSPLLPGPRDASRDRQERLGEILRRAEGHSRKAKRQKERRRSRRSALGSH